MNYNETMFTESGKYALRYLSHTLEELETNIKVCCEVCGSVMWATVFSGNFIIWVTQLLNHTVLHEKSMKNNN